MSTDSDELLVTLQTALDEIKNVRQEYSQTQKEKGLPAVDQFSIRLMGQEGQILKSISKRKQELESKRTPKPTGVDDSMPMCPTLERQLRKVFEKHLRKEMDGKCKWDNQRFKKAHDNVEDDSPVAKGPNETEVERLTDEELLKEVETEMAKEDEKGSE